MQIEIPDSLFERLKAHAEPFVDTPATVIARWADHFDGVGAGGSEGKASGDPGVGVRKFDPLNPPDLLHTRCRGVFGTESFSKWNDLMRIAHIQAAKKAGSFEALRTVTIAQIRKGNHADNGFRYVPEIGISLQGVDAIRAWNYSLKLAQYLGVILSITIEWRNNNKAEHPGESGLLEWKPAVK